MYSKYCTVHPAIIVQNERGFIYVEGGLIKHLLASDEWPDSRINRRLCRFVLACVEHLVQSIEL